MRSMYLAAMKYLENGIHEEGQGLHHDLIEEFFLTSVIIVEQSQVDTCLLGNVPRFGAIIAFLHKERAGRLFNLRFSIGIL